MAAPLRYHCVQRWCIIVLTKFNITVLLQLDLAHLACALSRRVRLRCSLR